MESLNSANILKVLINHKVSNTKRYMFFEELFSSFYYAGGEEFFFSNSRISKWIHGSEKISGKITEYYSNGKEKELSSDIYSMILGQMDSPAAVVDEITDCIKQEKELNQHIKEELLNWGNIRSQYYFANFIAHTLLFTMKSEGIRKSKKNESEELDRTKKNLLKDRPCIIDGEPPEPVDYFVGREKRIEELHELLVSKRKVFVSGLPGIGKSEFAKKYIQLFREHYDEVVYIDYSGNLYKDIVGLDFSTDVASDTTENRFKVHNRFLKTMSKDSLLIIDNFDTTVMKEPMYSVVMKYKCKVLITTRGMFHGRDQLLLKGMKSDDLFELSRLLCAEAEEWKDGLCEIFDIVHHHTYVVELISRLMAYGILEPNELFEQLKKDPITLNSEDNIQSNKDGSYEQATYQEHIRKLFRMSNLSAPMMNIMKNLSLFGKKGITRGKFGELMNLRHLNDVNELIELGYIQEIKDRWIKINQLLIEVLYADYEVKYTECRTLLGSMEKIFFTIDASTKYRKNLYEVAKNILDIVEDDDTDGYYCFLESVMRTTRTSVADSGDAEVIFKRLKAAYDKLENRDPCKEALFRYFKTFQCEGKEEYMKELFAALTTFTKMTRDNISRIVVVHTEWCWEMIGYGVYAEVIESCTKLLMLLKEWNMEDSDEYKTTRAFLYMTHQYQSYADTPVLTVEEEALLKKMPGTDMENGFRDKIASVVRFGTDENSKRKMSVIFVDEGNDMGHKAAGGF